jgi:RHS repeat-associated protein
VSASFQYDAFDRRVSKTVGGSTTGYLYDGADAVQEIAGGSAVANMLVGGVDEVLTRTDSAGTWNRLADGLGSTLALTDSAGAVQTQYTYDVFGSTTTSGAASGNPSQYTSRENDGTGLYYYRARYYSPSLQRFISQDPVGFGGGDVNFYAYVQNNPTNFIDPSGKWVHILIGAAVGAGSNIIFNAIEQGAGPCPFSWGELAGAGLAGGFAGAFSAAFPVSGFAGNAILGGVFDGGGQIFGNLLSGRKEPFDGVLENALGGAIAGGLGGAVKNVANPMSKGTEAYFDGLTTASGDMLSSGIGLASSFPLPPCGCK